MKNKEVKTGQVEQYNLKAKDLNLVQKYINNGAITPIGEGWYRIGSEQFSVKTGIGGCIDFCKVAEKLSKNDLQW